MKIYLLSVLSLFLCTSSVMAGDWNVSVAKYKGDKACAISYTFDDGLVEQYTLAAPELEKRGFRGTFGINGFRINRDAGHLTDTARMTWPQVKELSDRGHEISNHGWRHKNFARFPIEEIREDICKNDSAILAVTGVIPRTFLYPNNNKKAEGRAIAEQNRVGTRLEQRSVGSKAKPEYLDKWVAGLLETNGYGVGMTHGLTYGYDAFRNPQPFWDHLDKVKAQEDKIWVGTLREVLAYIAEQKATQLEVVPQGEHRLQVVPTLSLDEKIFTEPLTMLIKAAGIKKVSAKQGKKKLSVRIYADKAVFDFNPYAGAIDIRIK